MFRFSHLKLDISFKDFCAVINSQIWPLFCFKHRCKSQKPLNFIIILVIASWGGTESSIDVLIKPKVIENVTTILKSKEIPYSIMIEDLQQRINEENPPLDENDSELQDRRGS